MTQKLWPHQQVSIDKFLDQESTFDASDPGTGKTRVALELFRRREGKCMLVIAPKSLLYSAWGADIEKYLGVEYSIATAENREEAFNQRADIYITNTDAVTWLVKQPKAFFEKFDFICIDEITSFKHRTSRRSKALKKIAPLFEYRHGMTGTPNSASITDVWHQMLIIDGGERLGKNFFAFRNAACTPKQIGPSPKMVKWVDKEGAEEAVASLMSDITVRHPFEDVMTEVPPNYTRTIPFRMSWKQRKAYKDMAEDAIAILKSGTATAVNAAALRTKLLQIASGAVYLEDGSYDVIDSSRNELVLDLVEGAKHSIVFFNWKHQRHQLVAEAEKRGITYEVIDGSVSDRRRAQIVEAYQAGFYQTLFLHPKTGAHGLTLTTGTRTIWASPIYEPDFLKQGKHRLYRGGQTEVTETIMVEAEDSVERVVYDILDGKKTRMDLLSVLLEG